MGAGWVASVLLRDASIVDALWGPAICACGIAYLAAVLRGAGSLHLTGRGLHLLGESKPGHATVITLARGPEGQWEESALWSPPGEVISFPSGAPARRP